MAGARARSVRRGCGLLGRAGAADRRTGTVRPSRMPATVAWTPLSWISTHVATAGTASNSGWVHPGAAAPPDGDRQARGDKRDDGHVGREEHRDDGDRDEVVHDGEGEQERAQRRRQVRSDDREHRQSEGDVGRRGDRPAAQCVRVCAERKDADGIQESGEGHPATAAAIGTMALVRSERSPATNSRLSSIPATRKNSASRPSAAQ